MEKWTVPQSWGILPFHLLQWSNHPEKNIKRTLPAECTFFKCTYYMLGYKTSKFKKLEILSSVFSPPKCHENRNQL